MSYIEESLTTGEEIKANFKLHWAYWISFWLWVLLAPLTLGITLLIAIWVFLEIRLTEMGITTRRVVLKTGVISRKTEEMKNSAIETVEMKQSVMGRILGYGDIIVSGRGVSEVKLGWVPDPVQVKRDIENVLAELEAA